MRNEIPGILYHNDSLEIIRWLNKRKWGTVFKKGSPIAGIKAVLGNTEKRLRLFFKFHLTKESYQKIAPGRTLRVAFSPTNHKYVLQLRDVYIRSYSPPRFESIVTSLYSKGFSKLGRHYFKVFIPLSKDLNFHHQLALTNFTSDTGLMSSSCTVAVIDDVTLFACVIKDNQNGKKYLSIETRTKINFDSFKNKAHSVRNALGYLTGYLTGNCVYYFAFADPEIKTIKGFYYTEIRQEIKSGYNPLNSNSYSWVRKKSEARKYYDKHLLRNINEIEFSMLCQRLHDDLEFTTVVLLILESSIASLTFMPGGFAIALEMISDIITTDKAINLNPVKDKKLSKTIRNELQQVVDRYELETGEEGYKILSNKVNGINQVTNTSRLKAPFEILNITLLPADQQIINTRNDFLHGKVPDVTNMGADRPLERVNNDLYYASMRLYTLLNIVILKWIGFDNYVLNFPKIQEQTCKIKLREKHYRKV